ncbi:MFS transporter permease [uncultured Microbacterium sp.]|uniref:MFS transporter permease n=1 Tax=uncultured Microbacterium sp. TaxID=191216 RepID=UPI002617F2E2|nr:MFS transporter permease [uncultured Microbacterium sp.]
MWLRRFIYRWTFPAAIILPLWLLIGWGVFNASGWAILWVLFIAIPSVLIGEIVLALMMRARTSAREARMASWWDVLGFTVWHGLTIAVGFYPQKWFGLLLTAAIAAAVGVFWLMIWQLWNDARLRGGGIRIVGGSAPSQEAGAPKPSVSVDDVYIIQENTARRD